MKGIFTKYGIMGFIIGIALCFALDLLGIKNIILRISCLIIIMLIWYWVMMFINKTKNY
ncbi:hypothetical protein [Clostridium cochlearium]|uniref:Uncharacterized protein n=1 Tax=Clostridium cochlearium TaxID=1494 RepID=A0A7Y3XXB4_CLOCO|nr:hypothetical protein [Clostridium cochlearium]NOH15141.1 hypothetical protein [Clostridium cochlearium]